MYIPLSVPLARRQFTGNPARDTDITIGIIVAVVLTTFIAGVGYFLYRYRGSIRFTARRRKHGKRRKSTGSSKSGRSAAGEEPPPPPPPPQPPAEPPAS